VPLDRSEVLCRREVDGGAWRSIGGAGDRPALELGKPDGAWILEAPLLALDSVDRSEERLRVDCPAVDAVRGACGREMRDATHVLDPREDHGLSLDHSRRRVEH
jgi:hypothetical protein